MPVWSEHLSALRAYAMLWRSVVKGLAWACVTAAQGAGGEGPRLGVAAGRPPTPIADRTEGV